MNRNRRSRKKNRFYSALVAMLMVVAMAGSTVSTGMAAEISGDADEGQPTAYATVEDTGTDADSYASDAGLDEGGQSDWEGYDEYESDSDTGDELSDETVSVIDADKEDGESAEANKETAVSDYEFVAEYQGGAYQVGSEEKLSAEDFLVYVYDADGNLVDTIPAESVTSDYVVDEDGYILALVVCIYGGETITVEAKIMAIKTLAGDEEAFAVYSADDNSLTFYYGEVPEKGSDYQGKIVTSVYTGMDTADYSTQQQTPWYEVDESVTNVSFDESFGVVQPVSTAFWFKGFLYCISFDLTYLDTSQVTTMNSMFCDCESLESLDLSGLDVTNVTTMRAVVCDCHSLTDVNVSGMVTGKVTLIQSFFYDCYKLTSLDLTDWDTSGVDDMSKVFENCYSLESVNVSNWDTSNATNMWKMFVNCESLTGLDLTSFNTKKVKTYDAYEAFLSGCTSLQWLSIGDDFDLFEKTTQPLVSEQYWYDSITGEQVSDNYMIGVTGAGTYEVHDADISVFAVYSADDRSLTLYKDADGRPKKGDTYNDKTVTDVFIGFEEMHYEADYVLWSNYREDILQVVVDESFQEVVPRSTAYWFYDFSNCTSFDLTYLDTSRETDMGEMFYGCSSVTELDLSSFDTSNVTSMEDMFTDCVSLQGLDLSSFDTSNVTVYTDFLMDCTGLRWITISEDFDLFEKSTEALVSEPKWYEKDSYILVSDNYMIGFKGSGTYEVHEDDLAVFAVYSEDDHSLTLYKDEEHGIPAKGEIYQGKTVTESYLGFDGLRYSEDTVVPWHAHRGEVLSVAVDESFQDVTPVSTAYWFYYFTRCTSFDLGYLNTSNVTDMQSMFYNCASAASLDLSTFDTSNVTTTHCMFRDCKSLTEIDVGNFDTSSMTDMSQMFHTCTGLTELDLSHFNTDNLVTMANMFNGSSSLVTLNLRGWNTDNTTKMASEFQNCSSLKTIYVNEGDFDLDHHALSNDSNMFSGCVSILGQNGTTYDDNDRTHKYAHIDVAGNPGYLTDRMMFAVYCADDHSLTFYADSEVPSAGEEYDGKIATEVYQYLVNTGQDTPPWEGVKSDIYTVSCDESIEDFQPKSFYNWFSGMDNCTSLDLIWLDTTTATVYTDMMTNMGSLEWIRIGDNFDLFGRSSDELVSQQYWYDEDGVPVSSDFMQGIETAGTYYTYTSVLYNGDGTFKVVLVWDDEANNDGIRPEEVLIRLTKDNTVEGTDLTLTKEDADEDGNWVGTFTGLPKYENGKEITYSAKEDYTSGYTYKVELLTDDEGKTYVQLTNVHVSVTEDIEITKVWDDASNQDGKRPKEITVYLLVNGSLYKQKDLSADTEGVTVSEGGNIWKYTMSDIPVDKNGEVIEYTMLEVDVENYGSPVIETIRGDEITDNGVTYRPYSFVVTNSHTPEQIDITGTKVWDDANDQDGKRPQFVTLRLYADDVEVADLDVTAANDTDGDGNWEWAFTDLDKYADGEEIEYTVTEDEVTGYDTEITGNATDGYTITNSYEPETTTIYGSKAWEDNENAENTRPESITVRLHANGNENVYEQTVTADDGWAWEFKDVPVYSSGKHIDYTLTEDAVDDYDTTYTFGDDGSLNVLNTLAPGQTSLTVEKDWEDSDDQDGIRPTEVTVELLRDGASTGDTLTLSASNHWTDTFHELQEYDNGVKINYSVQEVSVDGYDSVLSGDAKTGYTITNSHTPEVTSVSGSKVWNDNDDQDGIRPDYVTIHLLANGEAVESLAVTADDNWTWKFEGLDKYAAGEEITYTMEEVFVTDGYEVEPGDAENDFTFTNTHVPEVIDITGTKTWDDDNDRDGIRPGSITVSLLAGDETLESKSVTEADNWTYTFAGYDKCANGEEIDYSVKEDVPNGYRASYTYSGYDVTNSHSPELFNGDGTLGVVMHWEDEDNQDGIRPKQTTITLTLNGVPDETITLVLSAGNVDENGNWIGTFADLYKYANGAEIEYNAEEDPVDGYTYTAELKQDEDTGLWYVEITNTHVPEITDITVTKIWDDGNNQDGLRPDSIDINLYANGILLDTATVTAADGWAWTFTDLPVYENGIKINYVITETALDDYDTTYSGFTVTNTCEPGKTSLTVFADWEDEGNQDGIRPTSITISLLADGKPALDTSGEAITLTLTKDENGIWEGSFEHLEEYSEGTRIEYSIGEVEVDGYDCVVEGNASTGYWLIFTHIPETIDISGSKTWDDADNQDGLRPDSITVHLLANGEEVLTKEVEPAAVSPMKRLGAIFTSGKLLSAEEDWSFEFTDVPKYANGQEITYTITETAVTGYGTSVTGDAENGFEIKNTHIPETMTISGTKVWDDAENQDGLRPDSITINLQADGKDVQSLEVTGDESTWEWAFTDIPKYEAGEEIEYAISEVAVDDYDTTVSGTVSEGFVITNTHEPETINSNTHVLAVTLRWDDDDNTDGLRPSIVTLTLRANGEDVLDANGNPVTLVLDGSTVDEDGNWIGEFDLTGIDLYRYQDGLAISYTVGEIDENEKSLKDDGYTSLADLVYDEATGTYSLEVTNVHTTVTQNITLTKKWDDASNQDGKRPDYILVHLKANGESVEGGDVTLTKDNVKISDGGNTWTYVLEEMPVDANGKNIEYSLEEARVVDYEGSIETVQGDKITENGVTYKPYSFTITNKHEPETIDLSGTIVWNDDDNKEGKRPDSVKVYLYDEDGNLIAETTATAENGWTWSFTNLPKYKDGKEISYRVEEEKIEGYTEQVVDGDKVIINTLTSDQSGTGGTGGTGGNGGGNGGNSGNPTGTVSNGGNGSNPNGIRNGRTGDTNTLPILLIVIFIAAAAIVVILVIRMTGRRSRRYQK